MCTTYLVSTLICMAIHPLEYKQGFLQTYIEWVSWYATNKALYWQVGFLSCPSNSQAFLNSKFGHNIMPIVLANLDNSQLLILEAYQIHVLGLSCMRILHWPLWNVASSMTQWWLVEDFWPFIRSKVKIIKL